MKIKELILYTQNLEAQIAFYSNTLELKIVKQNKVSCSFGIGESVLTFNISNYSKPYHFAFNIPSNKADEGLVWLKKCISLLPFDGSEMVHFKLWNAKALYFYDPDMNIVEFIARKNLNVIDNDDFSSKTILNISEIGVASTNIEDIFNSLNTIKPIEVYSGNFKRFCALGNEDGMFIVVNPILKKWFPTDDEIFITDFEIRGDYNFKFKKGKFIELM